MAPAEQWLDEIEEDAEIKACKERLLVLEEKIKGRVSDTAWDLLLEWESEWAHYTNLCVARLAAHKKDKRGN